MTAEFNLEWGALVRTEGAIHLEGSERIGLGNFENWNFGNAISYNLVIKFSGCSSSGNFAGFGNPMV